MLSSFTQRWNAYWHRPYDQVFLTRFRALFYALVFLNYFVFNASHFQVERLPELYPWFWSPISFFKFLPIGVFSQGMLWSLKWVWGLSLLLSAAGLLPRVATVLSAVLGFYLIGLFGCFGQYPLREYGIAASLVAFAVLAIDIRSGWPIRFMKIYLLLCYALAAVQKFVWTGTDYFTTPFLEKLFLRYGYPLGMELAQFPSLCRTLGLLTILIELAAVVAIFKERLRLPLALAWLGMHVIIEFTIGPGFWPHMITLLWFLVPETDQPAKIDSDFSRTRQLAFNVFLALFSSGWAIEAVASTHNWPFIDMKFYVFRFGETYSIGSLALVDEDGKEFFPFDDRLTAPLEKHVPPVNLDFNANREDYPMERMLKGWKAQIEKNRAALAIPGRFQELRMERRYYREGQEFDWSNPVRVDILGAYSDTAQ